MMKKQTTSGAFLVENIACCFFVNNSCGYKIKFFKRVDMSSVIPISI